MCIPTGGFEIGLDANRNNQVPVGAFAWGLFAAEAAKAGAFVGYLVQVLSVAGGKSPKGSGPSTNHAHDQVKLVFDSGRTEIKNASDLDPGMLKDYGFTFSSENGLERTSGGDGDTQPDSRWVMMPDGELVPDPTTPEPVIFQGPVGQPLFPLIPSLPFDDPEQIFTSFIPDSASDLAASAATLTNHDFENMLATFPDERIASVAPGIPLPADLPGAEGGPATMPNAPPVAPPPPAGAPPAQSSLLSQLQASYGGGAPPASGLPDDLLFSELNYLYGGASPPAGSDVPSYGPGDIVSTPAGQSNASAESAASPNASWTDGQGLNSDGRWVPNIFKSINKDLWAAWSKYSGAEAIITFPFVLAASGAVLLPQAIVDIPNIPTLFGYAIDEGDQGNWGKAIEALADASFAGGMVSELVSGVGALRAARQVSNVRGPSGPRTTGYDASNPTPPAWPVKNLRYGDPRVVTQSARSSCNAASTEMVARASGVEQVVNESSLLSEIRETTGNPRIALGNGGVDSREIVNAANALEAEAGTAGGQSWVTDGRQLANIRDEIDRLSSNGPWVAEMKHNGTYHSVTVIGMDAAGDVMVLDPAGYAYEMTLAWFDRVWYDQFIIRR